MRLLLAVLPALYLLLATGVSVLASSNAVPHEAGELPPVEAGEGGGAALGMVPGASGGPGGLGLGGPRADRVLGARAGVVGSAWSAEGELASHAAAGLFDDGIALEAAAVGPRGGGMRSRVVPEPGTSALLGGGLLLLALRGRRR